MFPPSKNKNYCFLIIVFNYSFLISSRVHLLLETKTREGYSVLSLHHLPLIFQKLMIDWLIDCSANVWHWTESESDFVVVVFLPFVPWVHWEICVNILLLSLGCDIFSPIQWPQCYLYFYDAGWRSSYRLLPCIVPSFLPSVTKA